MNLDEAIQHCEEVADSHDRIKQIKAVTLEECKCADDHRQLAEWLKELKAYREHNGDTISRQAVLDCLTATKLKKFDFILKAREAVKNLPPVTSQQRTGRWIPLEYDGYADGNPVWDKWECSKCGWEHSGDEESLTAFCPNCGAKMEVEE